MIAFYLALQVLYFGSSFFEFFFFFEVHIIKFLEFTALSKFMFDFNEFSATPKAAS